MKRTSVAIPASTGLPLTYREACKAVAECARIDECKGWADKASAIAAYAKMQGNRQLEADCKRIRLRATRRIGEMLGPSVTRNLERNDPARYLTVRGRNTARSVAKVPSALFEGLTEGANPPGVARMAALGTNDPKKSLARVDKACDRGNAHHRKWRTNERPNLRGDHILLDFFINRQPVRNLTVAEVLDWASRHLVIVRALMLLLENHDRERRVGDCIDEHDADAAMKLAKESI